MPKKGHIFTPEQRARMSASHIGQVAWNKGTGGCKRGHEANLYKQLPSGIFVCLGCKRENGAKYRAANRHKISLKNRVGRYKITIEQYRALHEAQDGKCAICRSDITLLDTCRIDHDHNTSEVRGLLCVACNTALGLLKDSPEVLLRAAEYLKATNA